MRYTAKEVNEGIEKAWQGDLQAMKGAGVTPTLATVRVGESGADISYEKGAAKKFDALGLGIKHVVLPADVKQDALIAEIKKLGEDNSVHGILLFQPLPEHLDAQAVKAAIDVRKDVDCATIGNLGKVMMGGRDDMFPYCAPDAVVALIDHYGIDVKGKIVAIVGSGLVVGRTLSMLLSDRLATILLCNVFTPDTAHFTRQADIVVSACGVPGLIKKNYVRDDGSQIVIDVGTKMVDGKLKGDLDIDEVEPLVKACTPTPGGISGITTTILAKHVISAAKAISGK